MRYVAVSFLLLLLGAARAAPPATPTLPATPAPPALDARAYFLRDFYSGRVLAEKNADERLEPASLTKMMTVYIVFSELREGRIHLDDKVPISENAWRTGGSRMFVKVGSKVTVENLLKGDIVQSGNDASVALAEYVAGSESAFAQLMNRYAKRLGMTNSHFVNPTGLPEPEHYSTAHDMGVLASALIREFPDYYKLFAIKQFTWNNITQYNRNRLLWRDDSVDGLKTGHTEEAGYCLVSSAHRNGMRLVSVVMGTPSDDARAQDSETLLNYGFRFFETHKLYGAGKALTTVRVWKGDQRKLGVGLQHDLYVTVPHGQYDKLKAEMEFDQAIVAPVKQGAPLGKVRVQLADKQILERPLVALQAVGQGSLWQRFTDRVRMMFH